MTANEIKLLRWAVRFAKEEILWASKSDKTLAVHSARIAECNKILRREAATLKATLASRVKHKGTRK